jgi:succinate-semialdehyde dehydrogenase/glutarate-semialdehyde dehydrogenase
VTADLATLTGIDAPTGLLIGGHWRTGRGGTLAVTDPATEDVIAQVANATTEDALDAVTAAHDALPGWAARPPRANACGGRSS